MIPAITVSWDDASTILRLDFHGRWSWSDFDRAWEQVVHHARTTPGRIDYVFDISDSTLLPPDLGLRIRRGRYTIPRDDALRVVVGADRFLQPFLVVLARLFSRESRLLFAASLEEARQLIHQDRACST
jgi:hypothetical protein